MARTDTCAGCFFYDWDRDGAKPSGTVTISIAAPAVFTLANHKYDAGQPIVFTTTGALPTGLLLATAYYVLPIDANTFNVAASPGGAAIATSGDQSGQHTVDTVRMGCHRQAPGDDDPSRGGLNRVKWKAVDRDYWCGDFLTGYPSGVGGWGSYASTIGANSGAFGVASSTGRFATSGKTVFFQLTISILTNGSAAGAVSFTLPANAARDGYVLSGMGQGGGGGGLNYGVIGRTTAGSNALAVVTTVGSYPGGDNTTIYISGFYESQ